MCTSIWKTPLSSCLSSCLSYQLFITFLPEKQCPRQESQATPAVDRDDHVTFFLA